MPTWRRSSLALGTSILAAGVSMAVLFTRTRTVAKTIMQCGGQYADSLQVQSARLREIEQGPRSRYSYLCRSAATYECPLFGPDGKLRRRRVEAVEHGTAFAYELLGNETYLLTNEHVASWPEVTDAAHKVDGVPEGCKRVAEKLRIVADEKDDYEPGQVALARVASDPSLDAAILKAPGALAVLPYRLGKSAALRQGNAVQVRGFPLGVMHAVNAGKVVNPYDHDQEQGWDHVDFVIDALLSEGNSGSPVLALSCASGSFELVGMYHAGYRGASALNVVVGIDQLREFMQKKRRVVRGPPADNLTSALGAAARDRLRADLRTSTLPLFDFGGYVARAEVSDGGAILYHLYGRGFPLDDRRLAVIEDRAAEGATAPAAAGGESTDIWFRGEAGWRPSRVATLGADERDLVTRAVGALRVQAARTLEYRKALADKSSSESRRRSRDLLREITRSEATLRDLSGALVDLGERLAPSREGGPVAANAPSTAAEPPPAPALPPPGQVTDRPTGP